MANTKRPSWEDATTERNADVFGNLIGVQQRSPEPEPQPAPALSPAPARPVAQAGAATPVTPVKRGRGRPRKVAPTAATMEIPLPTGRNIEATHSLNVRLPRSTWLPFRSYMGSQIRDMTEVIAALVAAFNEAPGTYLALIDASKERRVPLGRLLAPAVQAALEGFTSASDDYDGDSDEYD